MTEPDIVAPVALQHTQQVTCSAPWYVQNTEYPPAKATYQPLINGEEAFEAVHLAIAQATKTIDIICWGFQPSMYFIRDGSAPSIGELLMAKAGKGIEVRVLGWEMPFNAAGAGGEANLPGKGPLRIEDRAMQSSTADQYAEDRKWFSRCAFADHLAPAIRVARNVPVFVGRGFSMYERAEIAYQAKYKSLDPQLSLSTLGVLASTATHHQKTVLIDYEQTDRAVGFVMGHNMLDEYWDTDKHSALNRTEGSKPAPNRGPRGNTPRQDISSQISGPILEHLHHNFATAWRKETGEDLLASRKAMAVAPQLQCAPGVTRQLAQIVRTQAQDGKRDIEKIYLKAVNNATQFIYIENQYFRWPPLAEAIKTAAAKQTRAGRDPGLHGNLHLFVITNASPDGVGPGSLNTQRMLESLGRGDTIPEITKLQRIERAKAQANAQTPTLAELLERQALLTLTSLTDALGGDAISDKAREAQRDAARNNASRQRALKAQIAAIEQSTLEPESRPGLKIHVCSLVAPDSPAGQQWMPVYIHSKLMIVNDVFTTHGSANINTRSMQVDSELNIAHEWMSVTRALRRRLWDLHTDGRGAQDDPKEAFDAWTGIIKKNKDLQADKKTGVPWAPLVKFHYGEKIVKDLD
ncbi:phosphatidylserine/phosphatidylglycerophosphate/cardiolipin synthase-like enzyme [Pseudomonas marginalis]|uniref:phospholipase D-like domain-containing protein n=1 Tax=Pseudomonas marginalis TaxID=298 RepID=UPI0020A21A2D|nr:phospholipase [Pseudomonas marginalis]MCP1506959.1 phosphatidylserine/phosphatidylglycerophosphate/cardiolipin synthase-like enzyme [Pseudomonas marginalis]MCP1524463.1 phosphatidylserine/phosphatidylglycerophosphate/cardiolipin synthase-like enzyme [Pseudomonas marginalis]MDQ0499876.1 phosphatidylserine/phosphatidylglycerophosphate/cardiolipin synthase-like enzyme [Pseudomonas marginalis]